MLYIFFLWISSLFTGVSNATAEYLPDVDLKNSENITVNLKEYTKNDKIKVISLWATWCGPCRVELNALKPLYAEWQKKYNVEIIAISLDNSRNVERAKKMMVSNDWNFTFFHDYTGQLSSKLGIRGIPFSLVVVKNGEIISVSEGYRRGYEAELEKKFQSLIKKS